MTDPDAIAATLTQLDDVNGIHELARQRVATGDADFAADLGIALSTRYGSGPRPPWQYSSTLDGLLRLLTLTQGALPPALRMIEAVVPERRMRYAASLLASAHTATELDVVRPGELRACLVQELALRGAADMRHTGPPHPLAWLPPALTEIERRPGLPSYSMRGSGWSSPAAKPRPIDGDAPVPTWRETTTAAESEAISAAVANWAEHSNGRIEARTFAFDADLPPAAVRGALTSLDLASAEGLTTGFGACTAADAWQVLFGAASLGGAYNSGEYGAYGRLLAWRTIAALTGAAGDFPTVHAAAQRSTWFSFAATTSWFEQVAWDIGLAVVTPDHRRLAVLAATDTD